MCVFTVVSLMYSSSPISAFENPRAMSEDPARCPGPGLPDEAFPERLDGYRHPLDAEHLLGSGGPAAGDLSNPTGGYPGVAIARGGGIRPPML